MRGRPSVVKIEPTQDLFLNFKRLKSMRSLQRYKSFFSLFFFFPAITLLEPSARNSSRRWSFRQVQYWPLYISLLFLDDSMKYTYICIYFVSFFLILFITRCEPSLSREQYLHKYTQSLLRIGNIAIKYIYNRRYSLSLSDANEWKRHYFFYANVS